MNITRKQAKVILAATFPEYNGRKIVLEFRDMIHFYDVNWGGGSRTYYKAYYPNGAVRSLPNYNPWDNPVEGVTVPMVKDILIVTHRFFCGHDMGITIYAHPSWQPKWLEAHGA